MNKIIVGVVLMSLVSLFISCSKEVDDTVNISELIKDPKQQEELLKVISEDQELSNLYIDKMLESKYTTDLMIDKIVSNASNDFVVAGKLGDRISKHSTLMLMTTHQFMPIIASDEAMCEEFCQFTMEESSLMEKMHQKILDPEKRE